jgi:hypothetical protein
MEITSLIIESITNNTPISFLKYGDGEYGCATGVKGCNIDNDNYTEDKKQALIESFKYLINNGENIYIGAWHDLNFASFWESLVDKPINWAKYHTLLIDNENVIEKINLYKTIKYSNLKKIYICNPLLIKAQSLLNINYMIYVDYNNWFDSELSNLIEKLKEIINPLEQYIIMTSAGMGSKVVISELYKLYPNNIYLDFGSANDKICTKRTSRGWEPLYDVLMYYLKEILPEDWDDVKYRGIYDEAQKKLGVYLPPNLL